MVESLRQRINWIDLARGVAILAVVFGHSASPISSFIFSWHMPLFFFLSGFFINTETDFFEVVKNSFKKILIPFFIFACLGFLISYLKHAILARESVDVLENFLGIIYWMDYSHLNHYGFVLWFLPALFWGKNSVFWLVKKINNKYLILAILLVLFFGILAIKQRLPFGLDSGILAALWIYFGFLFYRYYQVVVFKYAEVIYLVIFALLVTFPQPLLNLSFKDFSNPIYNVFYSLIIILLVLITAEKVAFYVKQTNWLSYCGTNSLFIFIFHPYTNNIAYLIGEKYLPGLWLFKFLLSFVLIYLMLRLYRKYLNFGIFKYV